MRSKIKTDLQKGTELVCHTACIMNNRLGPKTTTVGKVYTIIFMDNYDDRFAIFDDYNDEHYFRYDQNGPIKSYEKWFHSSSKIIRKKKLEKILKINE